jgi:hypothetical protein
MAAPVSMVARHAVVHAAAPGFEALDDARTVESLGIGRLPLHAVLVGEGIEHLGHGDGRARTVLHGLRTREVFLGEFLARCGPGLLVCADPSLGLARVHRHVLETLGAHHRTEATACCVSGRVAVLLLVGTRHGCSLELQLARGPDGHEGGGCGVALRQVVDERVVPHALALGYFLERSTFRSDIERKALVRVRGLARHHDDAVADAHHVLGGVPARVGFLAPARERALGTDGHATRRGCRRSGEHTGRENKDVVRAQGVAGGVAFVEKNAGRQGAAAEQLPLLREGLDGYRLVRHVDADHAVFAHGLCSS